MVLFPVVIPAKAGIHGCRKRGGGMDSRFRGNDGSKKSATITPYELCASSSAKGPWERISLSSTAEDHPFVPTCDRRCAARRGGQGWPKATAGGGAHRP